MTGYTGPIRGICEGIYDGPHATPKESDEGPVFLGIKNVTADGKLDLSEIRHVSEQEFPRWTRRVTPVAQDIVFSYEATLHRYAMIPEGFRGCLGRRMALVRADPARSDPRFLYYYFLSPRWRAVVESSIITGATVDRIPLIRFPEFPVVMPPVEQQTKIAEILSAYDALIENNGRRIQLLEKLARLLYREWFVHLRFPGHEHSSITDGIPDGWKRKQLRDLCESVDYGYTASATTEHIGPKFLRITDIVPDTIDWSAVPHCVIDEERLKRFSLLEGDIVVARTGATVGYAKRLHKRHPTTVFASYLVRLRLGPELDNAIAGIFVESDAYKKYVLSQVGGAAQPNANAQVLSRAEIIVPPADIQRAFRESVESLFDLREILEEQSRRLTDARELLLPKLMSGEVEV